MEPERGFEPRTYHLRGGCSTTELLRRRLPSLPNRFRLFPKSTRGALRLRVRTSRPVACLSRALARKGATIPQGLLLTFAIVGLLFFEAYWVGTSAMYLGLNPSLWGLFGLLVPGISILAIAYRRRHLPKGVGFRCRMELTDPPRFSPIISSKNVRYELDFEQGGRFGSIPVDRRAPEGPKEYIRTGVFECVWWCWEGPAVRAVAAPGASFVVSDLPRGGNRGSRGFATGRVEEVLDAQTWRATRGALADGR
jgi:hypothetical protein